MHTVSIKNSIGLILLLLFVTVSGFSAGNTEKQAVNGNALSVLVYIPGVLAGSPPYSSMAEGATEFAAEHQGVTVKVYEAGFNQAEWEEQLTSLVATGQYDIVLTTNPSLSDISQSIAKKFPNQKFVITDAQLAGNKQIRTYLYNQYEQSYFLGYLAGLVTTSSLPYANSDLKIGFIAAQEFPMLNKQIIPGFLDGAHRVNPNITLDFRVIGNWYDANKSAELALSMLEAKVDVFMTLSGGADQGLFKIAGEKGAYIVFPNTNSYDAVPKMVVGCGTMEQKKLTKEILGDVLQGTVAYGMATTVGIQEGYIDFISDDPAYTENLPQSIRTKFDAFMADFRAGKIVYTVPSL